MSYLIHKRSSAIQSELYFAAARGHEISNLMHLAIKHTKLPDSNDFLCFRDLVLCFGEVQGLQQKKGAFMKFITLT